MHVVSMMLSVSNHFDYIIYMRVHIFVLSRLYKKSEYDNHRPQTNPQHREDETKNANSHTIARRQNEETSSRDDCKAKNDTKALQSIDQPHIQWEQE